MDAWGKKLRSRFRAPIEACRCQLLTLRDRQDSQSASRFSEVQTRLYTLLIQEETFWKQRSKIYWLKDGDCNTKFFHAIASSRRKHNLIQHLTRNDGSMATDQTGICKVAHTYFEDLYKDKVSSFGPVLQNVTHCISESDNDALLQPFSITEFRSALFSMHDNKSPGLDGVNPGFYKIFWDLLGLELFHACVQWLKQGSLPHQLSQTNIVLIPKIEHPTSMKDPRPISLCNVIYKIILKVLANRLKPLLPACISPEQSAFMENRSILDNVMVANEIIHYLKCKTRGKQARGLRQGDLLSPYLFIICTEGLSLLLRQAEARGILHGVKVCRGAPPLTHILFADDCFLFCKATTDEGHTLKDVLQQYEQASGQSINL
uniref:Transposon TX1 uncharacterized n=1 Tax=Cajanus cajan TaxID=3821 RepID=A0A151R091_CAJCA|nr:Transposon TX1 uncharacterized [Cajanus cajan]